MLLICIIVTIWVVIGIIYSMHDGYDFFDIETFLYSLLGFLTGAILGFIVTGLGGYLLVANNCIETETTEIRKNLYPIVETQYLYRNTDNYFEFVTDTAEKGRKIEKVRADSTIYFNPVKENKKPYTITKYTTIKNPILEKLFLYEEEEVIFYLPENQLLQYYK